MKTWTQKILLIGAIALGLNASAQQIDYAQHTEDAEVVCQMDDFVATKIYVDWDEDLDAPTGKNSSKIIERPTQHVFGNDGLLYLVEILKVEHVQIGDENGQVIYYRSQMTRDLISKLEVTSTKAKITVDVDKNGRPKRNSLMKQGPCELNEVY